MNTDRWYYRIFQGAPELIRELLPGSTAAANALGFGPAAAAGAAGALAVALLDFQCPADLAAWLLGNT